MKRIIFSIMIALAAVGATGQTLSVAPIEAKAGEQATLTVSVAGATAMTALQFNLSLPEGMTLADGATTMGAATDGHTLAVETLANGDHLFVLYSMDMNTLRNGELLRFPVNVGSEAMVGTAKLSKVRFADNQAVSHAGEEAAFTVTVSAAQAFINEVSELSNTKQYIIRTKDEARGTLGVNDGKLASTNPESEGQVRHCEQGSPFAIIQYNGHYYLYSTADQKFITDKGEETDEPGQNATYAVMPTKNSNGYFMFTFTATGNILNVNNNPGVVIDTWGQSEDKWDDGNQFTIEEAGDFDPAEALMMFNTEVLEPTDAMYEAALTAIQTEGQTYQISTLYNGKRYYLNTQGYLVETADDNCLHTFTRTEDSKLYKNPGWKLAANFTNPQLTNGSEGEVINNGHLVTDAQARVDWEGQVWYLADNGFYAVRATNATGNTWGANTYWTVIDNNADQLPEADYSLKATFVWQLTEVVPDGMMDLMNSESSHSVWYDLMGRPVNKATLQRKVIYIRNNKKVLVK